MPTNYSGTIEPELPDLDGNDPPKYNDRIKFIVDTDYPSPFVHLECFQNGVLVAEGWQGYFEGALGDQAFALNSRAWQGGAAHCIAHLVYSKKVGPHGPVWVEIDECSFEVVA